jgi:hypothetical protein
MNTKSYVVIIIIITIFSTHITTSNAPKYKQYH